MWLNISQGLVNKLMMNPDLIVLGDEYSKFGDSFLENIKIHIQKKILPSVFKNINFQLAPQTDLVIGVFTMLFRTRCYE